MKKSIIVLFFSLLAFSSSAQISNLQMQIEGMPQNMSINPALAPAHSYISLPLLGGLAMTGRAAIALNDITYQSGGVKYLDYNKLNGALSGAGDVNTINFEMDILRGGFRIGDNNYVDISLRSRMHIGTDLPDGILPFLLDNSIDNVSSVYGINMSPKVLGWSEFGIGYSVRIGDNFRVGARVKYLAGLATVQSDGMNFTVEKDYDKYYISGDYSVQGGNVNISNIDVNKMVTNIFSNPGFGIDLGVEYVSSNQKLKAMASVSDFGKIYWNDVNSTSIVSKSLGGRFEFTGFGDLSGFMSGGADFGHLVDSVMKSFTKTIGSDTISGGFVSNLPTRYHAMVEYAIDDYYQHNVSVSFMGSEVFGKKFDYALSAGYVYRSKSGKWQVAGNYTYRPNVPFGVGIGGAYTSRRFQIYLGIDNIIPIFDAMNAKNLGGRMSINFFL